MSCDFSDYYTGTLLRRLRAEYKIKDKIDMTGDFLKQTEKFRLESVIHDGQWYTSNKWARQAKVDESLVLDYIDKNPLLIEGKSVDKNNKIIYSYRFPGHKVQEWYEENNLDFSTEIIPGNFATKFWNGKTEVEWFLSNPLVWVSSVFFDLGEQQNTDELERALRGVATVSKRTDGKFVATGISSEHIKRRGQMVLSDELGDVYIRMRKGYRRRILERFPEEIMDQFYIFYIPYVKNSLSSSLMTMKTFFTSVDEIDAQICDWIHKSLRRFDERKPIPFPAYLSAVMRYWPYSISDDKMGRELATFQKDRARVEKRLKKEDKWDTGEDLAEAIEVELLKEYSEKDYLSLSTGLENWQNMQNFVDITELSTGTSTGENREIPSYTPQMFYERNTEDLDRGHTLAISILNAANRTKDYTSADRLIGKISRGMDFDVSDLSSDFLSALQEEITDCEKQKE